jgi:3-hydroxybutyryl-CoA dehydrogenase
MNTVSDIRRIAVIGTGMMGPGIALNMARAGYSVELYGRTSDSLARGQANLDLNCGRLVEYGLADRVGLDAARLRIQLTTDLAAAMKNADMVFESIFEDLGAKQEMFRQVSQLVSPDAILASNTSGIPIGQIAVGVTHPERFVGAHHWNPPYLMPLVEVIKAEHSSDQAMDVCCAVLERAGKKTVRVMKDIPGQLGNRLQHALWREALALAEDGVASPADIDRMIKYSFSMRMPPIGVFEYMDMVGIDMVDSIHNYLFADLSNRTGASPITQDKIRRGELGMKTGQGFFSWTPEKIEERKRLRDEEVVRQLRLAEEQGW